MQRDLLAHGGERDRILVEHHDGKAAPGRSDSSRKSRRPGADDQKRGPLPDREGLACYRLRINQAIRHVAPRLNSRRRIILSAKEASCPVCDGRDYLFDTSHM
jgi:hypothetical protein